MLVTLPLGVKYEYTNPSCVSANRARTNAAKEMRYHCWQRTLLACAADCVVHRDPDSSARFVEEGRQKTLTPGGARAQAQKEDPLGVMLGGKRRRTSRQLIASVVCLIAAK
jgi:hypothetical protein